MNEERGGQVFPRKMEIYPRIEQVRKAALEEIYEAATTPAEKEEVPVDAEFVEYLKIAGDYGGPKSVEELRKLSPEDQQFYSGAYREYLKEERKRKRLENLKKSV